MPSHFPEWQPVGVPAEVFDANIWRLSLSGPGVAAGPPARFIASTRSDSTPQYSPDGKRIAFESDRSGVHGIWISDADGSNAVELLPQAGASCGTARWSPDGQRIAFDSVRKGTWISMSSGRVEENQSA